MKDHTQTNFDPTERLKELGYTPPPDSTVKGVIIDGVAHIIESRQLGPADYEDGVVPPGSPQFITSRID